MVKDLKKRRKALCFNKKTRIFAIVKGLIPFFDYIFSSGQNI